MKTVYTKKELAKAIKSGEKAYLMQRFCCRDIVEYN